ncbi:VRR-NUC domain-containing protein [Acidisoma sp. 7E03]
MMQPEQKAPDQTEARAATLAMPPPYYLDHFTQVLAGVTERYGFLLDETEQTHMRRVTQLERPARQLYARLVNRRGPFFRLDKLVYSEIPSVAEAVGSLQAEGLVLACGAEEEEALACFTLSELQARLPRGVAPQGLRRADLLGHLAAWPDHPPWRAELLRDHPVIRLHPEDPWPFLRFLFFGALRDNLSDLVVKELGYVVPEAIATAQLAPIFPNRRAALDAYRMACLYERFRNLRDMQPAEDTLLWWQAQGVQREALTAGQLILDRLVERLGRRLERAGAVCEAIALYRTSPQAPARERLARLLIKQGATEEAQALLSRMTADPTSPHEAYVASELLRRMAGHAGRSPARARQKDGRVTRLTTTDGSVEQATLSHYARTGWSGIHSENWLWNALFGSVLWDIIYDPSMGTFHSPLQVAPADLYDRGFYARRQEAIEARLIAIADRRHSRRLVAQRLDEKAGIANPFLSWSAELGDVLDLALARLEPAALAAVLRRMAQDYRHHSRGFPDLLLWRDEEYSFVEVKSENDQLSPEQYHWLAFFDANGIPVRLENVRRAAQAATAARPSRTGVA